MLERAVNPEGIRPGSAIVSDTGALCIDESDQGSERAKERV